MHKNLDTCTFFAEYCNPSVEDRNHSLAAGSSSCTLCSAGLYSSLSGVLSSVGRVGVGGGGVREGVGEIKYKITVKQINTKCKKIQGISIR